MRNRNVIIIAVVVVLAVAGSVVGYFVHQVTSPEKVAVAGCMTKQTKLPSFAGAQPYEQASLPSKYVYKQKVAADGPYAGTYVRAFRAANKSSKTMQPAPFQAS